MDLIDIAADVIRERDQLKERVRELEERNEQLAEAIGEQVAIEELNARIAKAKGDTLSAYWELRHVEHYWSGNQTGSGRAGSEMRCDQCGEELTTGHGHMLPKAKLVDVNSAKEILMFQDRIRKAREILEKLVGTARGKEIMQAIAVLQGQDVSDYQRELENLQQELKSGSSEWKVRWDKDRVEELEERIAKAKAILEEGRSHVGNTARYTDYGRITKQAGGEMSFDMLQQAARIGGRDTRIKELEKALQDCEVTSQDKIRELEVRISKSREILKSILRVGGEEEEWADYSQRALEALEGK